MCSIGAGLVAGKEGPFIQCGACIAHLTLQGSRRLLGRHCAPLAAAPAAATQRQQRGGEEESSSDWQQRVHERITQEHARDAAAVGAGAGVAAAFIAPMAGASYAVEDAASSRNNTMLAMVRSCRHGGRPGRGC